MEEEELEGNYRWVTVMTERQQTKSSRRASLGNMMWEEKWWSSLGTRREAKGLSCRMRDLDNQKGKIFRQWGLIDTGMCSWGSLWNFLLSRSLKIDSISSAWRLDSIWPPKCLLSPEGKGYLPKEREPVQSLGARMMKILWLFFTFNLISIWPICKL